MASQSTRNHYEVLNCKPTDPISVIKKSYQSLVLKYHPDKNTAQPKNDADIKRFQEIDEAWKHLRDAGYRKRYDAEMQQDKFNEAPIVDDAVKLSRFGRHKRTGEMGYPCRCGGSYLLPYEYGSFSAVLEAEEEIYIECDECSLVIQLIAD